MLLSEICIKRPVFAIVLNLVVLTLGIIFFSKLQIRGLPDIDPPIVTITTNYSGADAFYMEKQVTARIEGVVKNIKNIDYMTSTSSLGNSTIVLYMKLNADIEIAVNDVRSKISDILNLFPQDMKPPAVSKYNSDNFPSLWLSVSSDVYDKLELTRIVSDNIQDRLGKMATVGGAQIYGGETYTMFIEPDYVKMYRHKISPTDIEAALYKQNKDYPAGIVKTNVRDFNLRLNASLNSVEEFENIILSTENGFNLKLKDVARVSLKAPEPDVILRYNGKRSMAIGLVRQSKSNIIDLSDSVRLELTKIEKNLPLGVKIDVAYDAATPVKASIRKVFFTVFEALILVGFFTYIFLGSIKITIIPFTAIPISLVGTFIAMYFFGFSINVFTLLAMILAIGLVVDDAIVVLENTFRHYENGKSAMEAAIITAKEIGLVIMAMTITLAAVFLPIGFIEGFVGKLFIEFAWTLAFCVIFSGFVAFTLTPMMCSRLVGKSNETPSKIVSTFEHYYKLLERTYLHYLSLALENIAKFLLIAGSSIVILVISYKLVNKSFMPTEDTAFFQLIFTGPEGSSLNQSEKVVEQAEEVLASHKDIFGYFNVIGWGGSDNAFGFVPLKNWDDRKKIQSTIREEINAKLANIPGMTIWAVDPDPLGGSGISTPVSFNLQTSLEYEELDTVSKNFIKLMKQSPVFKNIDRDFKNSTPTLDVIVNRDLAYLYGAGLDNIGTTIQYLIAGKNVGDFRRGNDIYDITLQYNKNDRSKVSDLSKIFIKTSNNTVLPLGVVAGIDEKITVRSYNHYNSSKSITISSDLGNGYTLNDAIDEINKIADKTIDPSNTKLEYLGNIKDMLESSSNLAVVFIFALIFIYLVLCAQFESFTDPFLILMAVPFSITGGVLSLLMFNNSINLYSNIGLITLIGLVTKNSIMIVEFTNQLRREQVMLIKEAILKAAALRLRPILMTSLTTIVGAVPLVLAHGAGAAARNSIGLVIVGGMTISTVFTVFVIPVLYKIFKKETIT